MVKVQLYNLTTALGPAGASPRWIATRLVGTILIGLAVTLVIHAQTSVDSPAVKGQQSNQNSAEDGQYRIGPGDVLDVKVLKAPELSRESVRVDQHGMIRLPLVNDDIKAACLTESQLARAVEDLYREYKRNPHVDIFVKDFESQPVAVIGAVNNFQLDGTQYKLRRRVKLLELLTIAGGPSPKAGRTVNIVHSATAMPCEQKVATPDVESDLGKLSTYQLADTLKGIPSANPFLVPGDIVVVPEGDEVYVVGNVMKPSTIPLREELTVSRAIAMAGGTKAATKKDHVRIVRQSPGGGKQEIFVNLSAIDKRQAVDLTLLPNDIVDVPTSGTKSFLNTLMGTVAPAVTQASVRIVP